MNMEEEQGGENLPEWKHNIDKPTKKLALIMGENNAIIYLQIGVMTYSMATHDRRFKLRETKVWRKIIVA